MTGAIVIQAPAQPGQLMLLFHGVGAEPGSLVPLGQRLAAQFPAAHVVSIAAAHRSDLGSGFQWFSVRGITEDNRPARIAEAMPAFQAAVHAWQDKLGLGPAATTLIGFSQGAIMALESTRHEPPLARRIAAIAGRFTTPPDAAPSGTALHFVHGQADPVVACDHSVAAGDRLGRLGGDVSVDLLPGVGHEISAEVVEVVLRRLAA